MSYSLAICDDDLSQLDYIKQMVKKWAINRRFDVGIDCFPSAEAFLFRYTEEQNYDILLLDIEMNHMNGVELARTIRVENKEVQIIFITGFMEYISDGYDVEALHYLLKPISENKFFSVLDRAVTKLKLNERTIILKLCDESVIIPLYEIRFMEVQRNYVTVHAKQDYTIKATLGELEKELDSTFYRVGRSFIVNLKYIRSVARKDIILSDSSTIPLPRGLYDAIYKAMIERL